MQLPAELALYDSIGLNYAAFRRPDRRIAALIEAALGDAATVLNVGAGAGAYEPSGLDVLAVEPSEVMIRQRPSNAARCLRGYAESLPVDNACVDAAMAILTVHHWTDIGLGLAEMRRAARRRVVLLTWVPDASPFWLTEDYFPEIAEIDHRIFPDTASLRTMLEERIGPVSILPVPIPQDCTDGSLCAYWRRPESYLRADVRGAISSFTKIDAAPGLEKLRNDLGSGRWRERNGQLLDLSAIDLGYRIFRCEIGA